jgi:predicted nicotinamide N-methyase
MAGQMMLGGKNVLELGSGPGLGGLIAARWASSVVFTDYQDLVMDLIRTNMKRNNPRPTEC